MGRHNSSNQLRKKVASTKVVHFEPQILVDQDADFASIKIAPGIEAKSYEKEGFVFCEDKNGKIIEVQVLNLSALSTPLRK